MTTLVKPLLDMYQEVNSFLMYNIAAVLVLLLIVMLLTKWWRRGEKAMASIEDEKAERLAMGELIDDLLIEAVANGKLKGNRALEWQLRLGNIFTLPIGGQPLKERLTKVSDVPFDPPMKVKKITLRTLKHA
jgi:hypothetical protein